MPKKKIKLFIRAYEKNDQFFAELPVLAYSDDKVFEIFCEYVKLVVAGHFSFVNRIDLVCAGRVLFSVCNFRKCLNQHNLIINFNPF